MSIFITSIITGLLGVLVGSAIGVTGFWFIAFALIGFSFPYAITLDKIYHMLLMNQEKTSENDTEYRNVNNSEIEVTKCPACFTEVSSSDSRCPSCGLVLTNE